SKSGAKVHAAFWLFGFRLTVGSLPLIGALQCIKLAPNNAVAYAAINPCPDLARRISPQPRRFSSQLK
ncbi:MAG: hypothetical protein WBC08_14595, partial [Rhodoferax sp.]